MMMMVLVSKQHKVTT